jgi:hypothetical protein
MIELNLLPGELRKKSRARIELPEIPLMPVAIAIVGALFIIQIALSGLIFLNKSQLSGLNKKWKELEPKKAELDGIKQKIADLTKKNQVIEELMKKQKNWARILNELSNSITPNIWLTDLQYEEKMSKETMMAPQRIAPRAMPKAIPDAAKIKNKTSREKGSDMFDEEEKVKKRPPAAELALSKTRAITLIGCASGKGEETTAHIARFIRALKTNENFFRDFEDVEVLSIKKGVAAGEDVMNFTLVCRFKPENNEGERLIYRTF